MSISDWSSDVCSSDLPTISQWLPGLAATSGNIMRRRLFGDFLRRYPRCAFDPPERARMIVALEHREVGDDHVDDILAGQRQRALGDELRAAVLGDRPEERRVGKGVVSTFRSRW